MSANEQVLIDTITSGYVITYNLALKIFYKHILSIHRRSVKYHVISLPSTKQHSETYSFKNIYKSHCDSISIILSILTLET